MKERPINFKSEFIPKILDGSKTLTVRPVKGDKISLLCADSVEEKKYGAFYFKRKGLYENKYYICPYGNPADRLKVNDDITLEITDIKVKRVQEISYPETLKEGINVDEDFQGEGSYAGAIDQKFYDIWNSIYGKTQYKWENNPWVWVINFKRLEG